jgi:hypothetical protein
MCEEVYVKRLCHEMNNFLEANNDKNVFFVLALIVLINFCFLLE